MNIVTKNGGKKFEKKFFQKHKDFASKQRWKKIVWKKWENTFFFKHTNNVTKKWGGKTREIIFSRNTRISQAKKMEKKSGKSAKTRFFINTRLS